MLSQLDTTVVAFLLLHSSPLLILSVVHNSSKEETPVIFVFYQTTGSIAMLAMAPVLSTLPIAIFSYTDLYDLRLTQNCHEIKLEHFKDWK